MIVDAQISIQYPANFPAKIKELIEMVPVPQGNIGDDLRPMLVQVASQNFSDVDLADIAAVLSLAPPDILEDIAGLIVHIVKSCWQAVPGAEAYVREVALRGPQSLGTLVSDWIIGMHYREEGRQLEGLTSRPLTFQAISMMIFMHSMVIVQPTPHERLRFVLEDERLRFVLRDDDSLYGDLFDDDEEEYDNLYGDLFDDDDIGADERLSEMSRRIKTYIASLPTVPKKNLDPTDKCGVCFEVYYKGTSSSMNDQQEERFDTALKLPCRHIFCAECLTDWLKTTSSRHFESDGHSTCPMCREGISIWD